MSVTTDYPEEHVMGAACQAPFYQILENAGHDQDMIQRICEEFDENGLCFNVATEQFGDMMEMGVVDPLKVTRNAIENAVSVATTILSTDIIIYNLRDNASGK